MSLSLWALDWATARRRVRHARDLTAPRVAQLRRLAFLLAGNRDTEFGRLHDFNAILRAGGLSALADFPRRRRAFSIVPADRLAVEWPASAREAFARAWRASVPPRPYEGFRGWIDRLGAGEAGLLTAEPVLMFSLTSGSVGTPKHCPVTRSFIREHHASHLLWMRGLAHDHPELLNAKYLTFSSPAEIGRGRGGIPYGAASGRQADEQSWPVRRRQAVPAGVFGISSHAAKYHAVLVHALGESLSLALTVNPSTLVLLAEHLARDPEGLLADVAEGSYRHAPGLDAEALLRLAKVHRPIPRPAGAFRLRKFFRDRGGRPTPAAAWPTLSVLATWQGGCAPFYRPAVEEAWGRIPQRCLGLRASEGTFTIPDRDNAADGPLAVGGHAVEFFPEGADPLDPARAGDARWADELEAGRRYRMVITTGAGLYRYDLADVVEVTGFEKGTPRLAFIRRAGGVTSVTGEKVSEDQVMAAMIRAQGEAGVRVAGYSVTVGLGRPPMYVLGVEACRGAVSGEGCGLSPLARAALARLGAAFDRILGELNIEYADRRDGGRLGVMRVLAAPPGTYNELRAAAVSEGRPDGQWKPPVLIAPASWEGGMRPAEREGKEGEWFAHAPGFKCIQWMAV